VVQDLTEESPTKFVRLLSEDLVLFKDKSGRVGLIADKCAHRSASMVYGRVEERGIACAYHGWLYDCEGNIIETPPERNDAIMKNVKTAAYPVQLFMGMYWAYLGPLPAPVIPHLDVWVRRDVTRTIAVYPPMDCNWLQAQENSVDPAHLQVLHQDPTFRKTRPINTTRGFTDDVELFEFSMVEHGIMKKRTYVNGFADEHPILFPNVLRVQAGTEIRVPIDDYKTIIFEAFFHQSEDGSLYDELGELPVDRPGPYKLPEDALHPHARMILDTIPAQDQAMWETQGQIVDRTVEHLSFSDRGIALFRKLVFENIAKVERGEEPFAVYRDPDHAMLDTKLQAAIDHRAPTGINTPTYTLG
jgi:5,5'-dehydrodivanillate O-demethylase